MVKVDSFKDRVTTVVAQIPYGRVMTYGQIAAICGQPRAARLVGGIAHFGDDNLPWQRVVNRHGGLASGYPGGRQNHKKVLASEGHKFDNKNNVDLSEKLWWPN